MTDKKIIVLFSFSFEKQKSIIFSVFCNRQNMIWEDATEKHIRKTKKAEKKMC